jgi:hypothetical protein
MEALLIHKPSLKVLQQQISKKLVLYNAPGGRLVPEQHFHGNLRAPRDT